MTHFSIGGWTKTDSLQQSIVSCVGNPEERETKSQKVELARLGRKFLDRNASEKYDKIFQKIVVVSSPLIHIARAVADSN